MSKYADQFALLLHQNNKFFIQKNATTKKLAFLGPFFNILLFLGKNNKIATLV
jgi:hypothetical protein